MDCLKDQHGKDICLDEIPLLVLYVYPKDNTPGCTTESLEFQQLSSEFKKLGATVVGLSKDPVESHKKFALKYDLSIPLLSDPELKLIKKLGAWGKKAFGREGVIRSTFIFRNGKLIKKWHNVKPKGHAREVLEYLKGLVR